MERREGVHAVLCARLLLRCPLPLRQAQAGLGRHACKRLMPAC